uniref:COesterase domain-containing protein n=1 Tax=Panagrellus redivivus TaxID=6233 RepID=A0A7E4WBY3_PANRE
MSRCKAFYMKNKCPVLFIIHDNFFSYDPAYMSNDDFLIDNYASQDIIVVVPSFRLGFFGFADYGSDKRIVRNVGLYDIVRALEWVQEEIGAFGGDPKRVTAFGHGHGASAITYLSVAQNVEKLWSSAVIISPSLPLLRNAYYDITIAIDEKESGRSDIDYFIVHRAPLYQNLLSAQKAVENDGFHQWKGISSDSIMFGNKTLVDLLDNWKAVPTLFGSTKWEFKVSENGTVLKYCELYTRMLDYYSDSAVAACTKRYSDNAYFDNGRNPVSGDGTKAFLFRLASTVANLQKDAYIYSFELEDYDSHGKDLTFAIGLPPISRELNAQEALMMNYVPAMLRSFITDNNVRAYLTPFENGKFYKLLTMHDKTLDPVPIKKPYFPEVMSYWFDDLGNVEKDARVNEAKNRTEERRAKWATVDEREREKRWRYYRQSRERAVKLENRSLDEKLNDKRTGQDQLDRKTKENQFVDYLLLYYLNVVANGFTKVIKANDSVTLLNTEAVLDKVETLIDNIEADSVGAKPVFDPWQDQPLRDYLKLKSRYYIHYNRSIVVNNSVYATDSETSSIYANLPHYVRKEASRGRILAELKEVLKRLRSKAMVAFRQYIEQPNSTYSHSMPQLNIDIREIVLKALVHFRQLKPETLQIIMLHIFVSKAELPFLDDIYGYEKYVPHNFATKTTMSVSHNTYGRKPTGFQISASQTALPLSSNAYGLKATGFQTASQTTLPVSHDAYGRKPHVPQTHGCAAWPIVWIVISATLSTTLLITVILIIKWFKSQQNPVDRIYYTDPGLFTEKSKMLLADV